MEAKYAKAISDDIQKLKIEIEKPAVSQNSDTKKVKMPDEILTPRPGR